MTSSAEHRKDTERRIKEQEAIEKVRQEQKKHREADLRPQAGINVPLQNFPVVHPNLAEVTFYQGGAAPKQKRYVPSTDDLKGISHERSIDFDDLVRSDKRYTGMIGNPGAGKSTLSKRLAKTEEYTTFHVKFSDLPGRREFTLREMLIDNNYINLDDETCKHSFEWVKNNQSHCLIIFDGLDQANWAFKEEVAKLSYHTKQSVQNIIANIFNKHYLPDVKIIITSRPHSMLNLPHSLQPNRTIFIRDLSYDDMKTLFYAYTGTRADELWFQLSQNAPAVFSLCYNPLLLQLVITASLNPSKDVGEITTTTRVFATVLEGLRRSDNTKPRDIAGLILQISKLAYNATKKSTVVITPTEMEEEGLSSDDVQDIIVALHAYVGFSQRVFDGDQKYFFSHQMFQECFTARYIISQMSLDEFMSFVANEAFADEKWSVVRRFICGLLVDMLRDCHVGDQVSTTDMQTRSTFLMESQLPSG
ncbi:NACHT, LRR and PYD domains-containing protein 12-like [Clavelina lepadiformis]|uniref:NACHT, LRR and PYD domains-containing protein 12-like n=1 Tax=Clavelina lepadiformis TaxID=159417 RepID=UPI0040424DA2